MKRGISPVIATLLLIAIVVVLAFIIFLWARGFVKEAVMKSGKSADYACNEIRLETNYLASEGKLQLINIGNTPVYSFKIKKKSGGEIKIQEEKNSLAMGQTKSIDVGSYEEIEIVPVVLGTSGLAKKAYTCKNSFFAETK